MVEADESDDSTNLKLEEGFPTVRTTMNRENIQQQNHKSTDYESSGTVHDTEFPSPFLTHLFNNIKVETVSDTTYADSSSLRETPCWDLPCTCVPNILVQEANNEVRTEEAVFGRQHYEKHYPHQSIPSRRLVVRSIRSDHNLLNLNFFF